MRDAEDRRTRHQKGFQDAAVDQLDRAGYDAFVVVTIEAVEIDAADLPAGGIEDHAQKIGKHRAVDALGEGLAFILVLLAMAFDAVSEDLVEEDAGGAAGEDGGSDERIDDRSFEKAGEILGDAVDGG